jgi:hypothetical protein
MERFSTNDSLTFYNSQNTIKVYVLHDVRDSTGPSNFEPVNAFGFAQAKVDPHIALA